MVRVGEGGDVPILSDRVVRSVVLDARRSHDEMRVLPERSSIRNLERWDRAKKLETSVEVGADVCPTLPKTIDSVFSF